MYPALDAAPRRLARRMTVDESVSRSAGRTADEAGRHRTMVIVLAVAALVLMAAAWLLAAPAAGALVAYGAFF